MHSGILIHVFFFSYPLHFPFRKCMKLARALTFSFSCGTMATDGMGNKFVHSLPENIRKISPSDLHLTDTCIGKGIFGKCYAGNLAHIQVCVKVLRNLSDNSFPNEVYILSLCCHENIPWLYGFSNEARHKILVMSFHGISGKAYNLRKLLQLQQNPSHTFHLSTSHLKTILLGIISALKYIHLKGILHNDIKCDNVAIESIPTGYKSILLDFGKSCFTSNAKQYTLSAKDKLKYIERHPHIAPDLREGYCKQSMASDIFSFGRILKIVNDVIEIPVLNNMSDMCTAYKGSDRPTTEEMFTFLSNLFS